VSKQTIEQRESSIAGRRVMLVGKLASMPRREAEQLVREHGGLLTESARDEADLIVASDDSASLQRLSTNRQLFDDELRARIASGQVELIGESELWARMGLVESGQGIERLYTPAMLAELVHVPIAAIRQWRHSGAIIAKREVQRLPYFDFEEVRVARKLAQLLAAGGSLAAVNRKLKGLARLLPGVERPLADPAVVVEGRRLFVRRDEGLSEPTGQLLIDFDAPKPQTEGDVASEDGPVAIPMVAGEALHKPSARPRGAHPYAAEDLRALAAELEGTGQPEQAVEVYRAVLFSGDSTAEDQFALAELLYLGGDLAAARERYYAAIELDEDFVEARSNLGCVLAELGEVGLAEAAFRGALEYHPDYADAHYHLARLLDRANRSREAACHWQLFMNLAPASPWADEARDRMTAGEEKQ
jgi:TPR repeat/MerR HTH family regulatory protein/Tetratricopeptide repeat